ncbi:MAG: hypothetical protein H7257_00330 [Taibaiella sp.]|nr:hypothetical protein [Taibaiella sp.]
MTGDLLKIVNQYAAGLQEVAQRRNEWLLKYKLVRDQLKQIATELNENADYKPGFYVDSNRAFNEEINGTCAEMPSLTFRCGDMPLELRFKNAAGERREFVEKGFSITFDPTITGQIIVTLQPHVNSLSGEKPQPATLAVIDKPANLTPEIVTQIMAIGIQGAFYTSFTGALHLQEKEINDTPQQKQYSPIGFKRYASTEKVQ